MTHNYNKQILTVLVCCYNAAEFLKNCVDSLERQAVSNYYKILFINDGSTDDSFKIANDYSHTLKNFSLLNNKKRVGLVRCCNKALGLIDTLYFMRLDADDYLSDDALIKILPELGSCNKEDFIVFSRYDICDDIVQKVKAVNNIYTWISGGAVFNTEAVRSVGGYSKEYWEEYDLYIKLLEKGAKFKISPSYIYYYRRGHNSMTLNYKKNYEGFQSLREKWGLTILGKYGDVSRFRKYYKIAQRI